MARSPISTQEIDELDRRRRSATSGPWKQSKDPSGPGSAPPPAIDDDGDGIVYRDFNPYAYDFFITRTNVRETQKIARQWGVDDAEIAAAKQRLDMVQRTPANTLSSNVGGLTPPQHIAQIFQVINKSRALVEAATRADLERGPSPTRSSPRRRLWRCRARRRPRPATPGLAVVDGHRDRLHVSRWRRPSLAGDQLVDPVGASALVRSGRSGLRAEDGDGRGHGRVGVGVPEQHRLADRDDGRRSRS